jgi:hypothetical protein
MVERQRFKHRALAYAAVAVAVALAAGIMILPDYLKHSRLMAAGAEAYSDERWADAVEAYEAAHALESDDVEATRELKRSRVALASFQLEAARDALDRALPRRGARVHRCVAVAHSRNQ